MSAEYPLAKFIDDFRALLHVMDYEEVFLDFGEEVACVEVGKKRSIPAEIARVLDYMSQVEPDRNLWIRKAVRLVAARFFLDDHLKEFAAHGLAEKGAGAVWLVDPEVVAALHHFFWVHRIRHALPFAAVLDHIQAKGHPKERAPLQLA